MKQFGTLFNLNTQAIKYHCFLSLGFTVLSTYSALKVLGYADAAHSTSLIGLGIGLAFVAMSNGFNLITGVSISQTKSFFEWGGFKLLNKQLKKAQQELVPFKGKALTFEQNKENKVIEQFIATMYITSASLSNWSFFNFIDKRTKEQVCLTLDDLKDKSHIYLPFYEKHFRSSFVLLKNLIRAITDDKTDYPSKIFLALWPAHKNTFTQGETQYLEKHLDFKKIKKLDLFKNPYLFKALSFKLQENILVSAQKMGMDKINYEKLLTIHQEHAFFNKNQNTTNEEKIVDSLATNQVLEQEKALNRDVVINPKSQQKLDTFEKRLNFVYQNEKAIVDSISQLLLAKEKLSFILEHSDEKQLYIEAKLFLDNDVDKVIKSFNEEILILMKMKINEHPQFEQFKENILDSINERVHIVKSKMLEVNQRLNEVMEQDLVATMQVNQTVLRAKM